MVAGRRDLERPARSRLAAHIGHVECSDNLATYTVIVVTREIASSNTRPWLIAEQALHQFTQR